MIDGLFDALANDERRRLLDALERNGLSDDGVTIPVASPSERVWGTSRARLYHVHLPKLAETDVVEWDRTDRRIEKGPRFEDARRLLRLMGGFQDEASADA